MLPVLTSMLYMSILEAWQSLACVLRKRWPQGRKRTKEEKVQIVKVTPYKQGVVGCVLLWILSGVPVTTVATHCSLKDYFDNFGCRRSDFFFTSFVVIFINMNK